MVRKILTLIVPPLIWRLSAILQRVFQSQAYVYSHKNYKIILPRGHLLPEYQKQHVNYDRFLPHLVRYIDDGCFIDVGANCGDTLVAVGVSNPNLSYLCIEPDDFFFDYLKKNYEQLLFSNPLIKVRLAKKLVGLEVLKASLTGSNGTKFAVLDENGMCSVTLDQLVLEHQIKEKVNVIKVDVDGYDYDVINSGKGLIVKDYPLLFFEVNFSAESQYLRYKSLVREIYDIGYKDWTIFDNFGSVMLRTNNLDTLNCLLDYLHAQINGAATKTIPYYDLLAGTDKDVAVIDGALKSYEL